MVRRTKMKITVVISLVHRYHKRKVWKVIRILYMKGLDTLAGYAVIKQLQSHILLNTKGQLIKESNTFADNVTIKQLQSHALVNTKGQYMKESNTLVSNVDDNFL